VGRKLTILVSFLVYAVIYFLFGFALNAVSVWLLFAGYGLYLGFSKGVFRAFIADLVPQERRATAYGIFETAIGVALLPASLLFGLLWDTFSAQVAFSAGAGLALVAGAVFLFSEMVIGNAAN
jgi:MFS family permease